MTQESNDPEHRLILDQLDKVVKKQCSNADKLNTRLSNIDKALVEIVLQKKDIENHTEQLNALWKSYYKAFGVDGSFAKIQQEQAMCPKNILKEAIKLLKEDTERDIAIIEGNTKFNFKMLWGAITLTIFVFGVLLAALKVG